MNDLYELFQKLSVIEEPLNSAEYIQLKKDSPSVAKKLASLLNHNNTSIDVLLEKLYTPLIVDDNADSRIGRTINNKYKITALLGQGGMSDVYKAIRFDGLIEHTVAVKYFSLADSFTVALEMIKKEAQILSKLDHHYIASFIDIGHDDHEEPNIMMEYIEGQTLFSYLKTKPNTDEVAHVYSTLDEATVYAENQGIIHGDISQNNVIVDINGNANIIDFDMATYSKA